MYKKEFWIGDLSTPYNVSKDNVSKWRFCIVPMSR
jgi:hypothetical protein